MLQGFQNRKEKRNPKEVRKDKELCYAFNTASFYLADSWNDSSSNNNTFYCVHESKGNGGKLA